MRSRGIVMLLAGLTAACTYAAAPGPAPACRFACVRSVSGVGRVDFLQEIDSRKYEEIRRHIGVWGCVCKCTLRGGGNGEEEAAGEFDPYNPEAYSQQGAPLPYANVNGLLNVCMCMYILIFV